MLIGKYSKGTILRVLITGYWTFFWLLNVVDKFVGQPTFLWYGKDRMAQLIGYFASIGVYDQNVALVSILFTTVLEATAFIFGALALWFLIRGNDGRANNFYFRSTVAGMLLFTFFSLGDQVFGERGELLEHTTYWIILLVSLLVFRYSGYFRQNIDRT